MVITNLIPIARLRVSTRRRLELFTQLVDQHPDSLDYRSAMADIHGELATLLASTGKAKDAEAARRDQVAALKKLLKEVPPVPENRLSLAWLREPSGTRWV
jgi:hypothetical protein